MCILSIPYSRIMAAAAENIFSDPGVLECLLKNMSVSQDCLERWLRTPPRFTVARVNTVVISRNDLAIRLEAFLKEQYEKKSYSKPIVISPANMDDVLVIESSGAQAAVLPDGKEVVVGSLCGYAVLRGADVFAPGVLGTPFSLQSGDKVAVYSDVDSRCLRGMAKPFAGRKSFVGNGRAKMSRDDLFRGDGGSTPAGGVAVEMTEAVFDCPSLNALAEEGLLMLQNLPSIICGHVLGPEPGETVLDMCAAPGGKTTHLATLVGPKGNVKALDRSSNKIKQIVDNCTRLRLDNVSCFAYDAAKSVREDRQESAVMKPPFPRESFSKILLDAPCSALGQRPQFAVGMKLKEFQSFPVLQKKLFRAAVGLLQTDGHLVYSTCSPSVEENEMVVAWALQTFPELSLLMAEPKLGRDGVCVENFDAGLAEKVQRFSVSRPEEKSTLPEYCSDTIGFFIAKFAKRKLLK